MAAGKGYLLQSSVFQSIVTCRRGVGGVFLQWGKGLILVKIPMEVSSFPKSLDFCKEIAKGFLHFQQRNFANVLIILLAEATIFLTTLVRGRVVMG